MRLRNGAVLAILVLFKEDRRLRLEPQAFKKCVCGTLVLIFMSSSSKGPEARPLDCWGVYYSYR
jgi:hypothetical protein